MGDSTFFLATIVDTTTERTEMPPLNLDQKWLRHQCSKKLGHILNQHAFIWVCTMWTTIVTKTIERLSWMDSIVIKTIERLSLMDYRIKTTIDAKYVCLGTTIDECVAITKGLWILIPLSPPQHSLVATDALSMGSCRSKHYFHTTQRSNHTVIWLSFEIHFGGRNSTNAAYR